MDQLESIRTFLEVVHSGSMMCAARKLNTPYARLGYRIRSLESHLGVQLFSRETRSVSLTEAGRLYFNKTQEIVRELDDFESSLANMANRPIGTLRVVAPDSFSHYGIAQFLYRYNTRYPDVRLSLTLVDRPFNLVRDGFDVGLIDTSTHRQSLTSIIARPITSDFFIACASPGYLLRRARPSHARQLIDHTYVALATQLTNSRELLLEGPNGAQIELEQHPAMVVSNVDALIQILILGMGIGFIPSKLAQRNILDGSLQNVLPEYSTPRFFINVIYPSRKHLPAKVRTFIDYMCKSSVDFTCEPMEHHMRPSMNRPGNCRDGTATANFSSALKEERIKR
ncbi:LysR family transcriptional regulator [Burkholderia cepacia]|uniref:LysR family transcriptional regulator n=1 Tax=Burkholderia cepacia TaxID=292 RepID=UPI00158ED24C|nr:LysR family transcriptional regulator [Burkholderia cepacia]